MNTSLLVIYKNDPGDDIGIIFLILGKILHLFNRWKLSYVFIDSTRQFILVIDLHF